jgi:hypothetical protein
MGVKHRDLGIPFERPLAGEAEVEDAGERVLVASAVERLALDLLRGGVIDAADELAGLVLPEMEERRFVSPKSAR